MRCWRGAGMPGGRRERDHTTGAILQELAELWVSLGKEIGPRAILRRAARMRHDAHHAGRGSRRSDRRLVDHGGADARASQPRDRDSLSSIGARELASRVFSQCWMPFGHRRQICCEQIEISASDASLPDLAPVVLPLAVADLPVIVWCRSARLFDLPDFPQMAKIANKLLLDSSAFPGFRGDSGRIRGRWEGCWAIWHGRG